MLVLLEHEMNWIPTELFHEEISIDFHTGRISITVLMEVMIINIYSQRLTLAVFNQNYWRNWLVSQFSVIRPVSVSETPSLNSLALDTLHTPGYIHTYLSLYKLSISSAYPLYPRNNLMKFHQIARCHSATVAIN